MGAGLCDVSIYGIGITPDDTEHQPLPIFFGNPATPLDSASPDYHDYASYVFPLWAARSSSNPQIVRDFWNGVGTKKSLEAGEGRLRLRLEPGLEDSSARTGTRG